MSATVILTVTFSFLVPPCSLFFDPLCACSPWTGKCIGKGNLRFFYAFLWMLSAHLALVLVSTVAFFIQGGAGLTTASPGSH